MIEYPEVAQIDCGHCSEVLYSLETGEPKLNGDEFIPVQHPPCHYDKSVCPKGEPGKSDLNAESRQILRQYLYYRSIGKWPDDIWVNRYKVLLDQAYEAAERGRLQRLKARAAEGKDRFVVK